MWENNIKTFAVVHVRNDEPLVYNRVNRWELEVTRT